MSRPLTWLGLGAAILVTAIGWWLATGTDSPTRPRGATIAVADLPSEGRAALDRIAAGGPFPYDRDGAVFENRERLLPSRPRGYYHEYTVRTPGSDDRGARRIVTGSAGDRWYTDDHYESFTRISP